MAYSKLERVVITACTYEVLAISLHRPRIIPPISHICWRYPVMTPVVVTCLALHLSDGKNSGQYVEDAFLWKALEVWKVLAKRRQTLDNRS